MIFIYDMKKNVVNKFNNICKYKFNNNKLKFHYSLFQ